ncbi:helix-turn-helix transcriptional regulator [Rickettsiella endosymbiont of Dermanyssus gallinae]|uniref:helix-turn-helix transcriptional regulator n=1 Tax=Rickettsiella endosymbiont of Dermanyssus gallinae TaxID=2856608 RepID=UPI001C533792|nr:helix-turn-helix transcriptional regulator [Rickettsiella endosymbiont of Dermanyssus gallinae]
MAYDSLTREELFSKLISEENECFEIKARISLFDKGVKNPTKKDIEQEKCHLIYKNGKESSKYIKPLSKLEYDCLVCACAGKNAKQTAEILDISERSAKKHRNLLIQKTGCRTIYEVTHLAKSLFEKKKKTLEKSSFLGVQKYPFHKEQKYILGTEEAENASI